jgi:hypothetical protein
MKWNVWCLCAAALLATGCAAPKAAYMPAGAKDMATDGAAPAAQPSAADRATLEAEVANIERKKDSPYLEELGVEASAGESGAPNAPASCQEVCQVADGICASSARICEIAEAYPDEGWFAERCGWSRDQCDQAQRACQSCQGAQ